jgi:hypothetical protein
VEGPEIVAEEPKEGGTPLRVLEVANLQLHLALSTQMG